MTKGKGKSPGSGGLNKHIKNVAKKERAQPAHRKRLGPLEKHKDYKKRSAVRKERVKRVQQLKRAAALRNPDEFNVKMTQYQMDPSTGKMKKIEKLDNSEAALKKAITEGRINGQFLQRKADSDLQKARELTNTVGGLQSSGKANSHVVFVDSAEHVRRFNPMRYFKTTKEMLKVPALRGNTPVMAKIRVAHALDKVDDATLLRRFRRGNFDWDEELYELRMKLDAEKNGGKEQEQKQDDDDNNNAGSKKKKHVPLEDSRSLRESLLGKKEEEESVAPAVLLRMLRRAAVLEAQHKEQKQNISIARKAKEVVERVSRADRLNKLAKVVQKKTEGKVNVATEKQRQKFRPGTSTRTK